MGRIGELTLIVLLILILFGAGKLPQVMGDIARGLRTFKNNLTKPLEKKAKYKKRRNKWRDSSYKMPKSTGNNKNSAEVLPIGDLAKNNNVIDHNDNMIEAIPRNLSKPNKNKVYKFKSTSLRNK